MSSSERIIFNCGTSHVTVAVVAGGSQPSLTQVHSQSLGHDYSDGDAWLSALTLALRQVCQEHGLSGPATFILPGHELLTKTLRIPHVEDAKRAQIVAFEAQQNIPYPLSEVVWDTQVVADDGVETEVLFIASKSDAINQFCREVSGFGLVVEKISAATVLEYNALKVAYPKADGDTLLINIGARSSNLLFANEQGFFVRNIALGGNTLTQAIADSIGKSFSQAEAVKISLFGGEESNLDAGAQKLIDTAAETFMKRLNQEITRSIVNYRRQKGGKAPKRILLSGRGSLVPSLSQVLADKQSMDVEYFDPLSAVTIDGGVSMDVSLLRLQTGEIIGEALHQLAHGSAGVNLLPSEIQSSMAFAKKKPILAVAAILLALSPFPAWMVYDAKAESLAAEAAEVERQVSPLRSLTSQILETRESAEALREQIQMYESLANSRMNWIEFMNELQSSLNRIEDTWIDDLRISRRPAAGETPAQYTVNIEGRMLIRETAGDNASVDENRLAGRIQFLIDSFVESRFVVRAGAPNIRWTSIAEGLNVLPFSIALEIDPSRPL